MCGRARIAALTNEKLKLYNNRVSSSCPSQAASQKQRNKCGDSTVDDNQSGGIDGVELNLVVENFGPGVEVPVVICDLHASTTPAFSVRYMKWGMIPLFTEVTEKPDHFQLFNKRIETVNSKEGNYFLQLVQNHKRCVVVFDGFYEWKTVGGIKSPHYIHFENNIPLQFAAIYEDSQIMDPFSGNITTVETFSILTCEPCDAFKQIHIRQPIFLSDEEVKLWLDPKEVASTVLATLWNTNVRQPTNIDKLRYHAVTNRVTDVTYQQTDCSFPVSFGGNIQLLFQQQSQKNAIKRDHGPETEVCFEKKQKVATTVIDLTDDDTVISPMRQVSAPTSKRTVKKGNIESYFALNIT